MDDARQFDQWVFTGGSAASGMSGNVCRVWPLFVVVF
jgi:hypothetical protein